MARVTVVGTGYVGLIQGVCLADVGHDVICVDIDADKIERLRSGEPTIYEPGLDELLQRNASARVGSPSPHRTTVGPI